ncbi:hypothetical protein F9230_09855 [Acinetobacter johnsonii]|uniref:hypothetical protein n=2 Tax=Acinetobacter johnsonii TaxID=40214 RepID=UPI0011E7E28F|nr:hypothetical protein [Acinetobacter johnsonii]QEK35652.1 hypothetical protein FYN22_07130 [Acinetobacter johnsonii]UJA04625.1 hypothetical protein F9230_09855 [Acinetobacter johnsonii]
MKLKEFSLTDIIAVISTVALVVTMASQTYFYYKLDALWVMSILSPSVYFIEVMKVLLLTSILIVGVSIFETIYSFLLKILIIKRKIPYKNNEKEINILLIKNKKSYIRGFTVFSILLLMIIFCGLSKLGISVTNSIIYWTYFILGLSLALLTNKSLDLVTRRLTLILIVISVTALNAEIKISRLKNAPVVFVKESNSKVVRATLVEAYQDKIIVANSKDLNGGLKILKLDQVEKIVPIDSMN